MSEAMVATRPTTDEGAACGALLVLHAQTPLHPGCGTALGTVDLPVQRERHTRWPLIPASSIKGVVRDACRRQIAMGGNGEELAEADRAPAMRAAFGPSAFDKEADARENAGALVFTDARLLAFPVRSLRGVFAWVSSPAVLERFVRDHALLGRATPFAVPTVAEGEALVASGSPLVISGSEGRDAVVLEEFELRAKASDEATKIASALAACLPGGELHAATRKRFERSLVIVDDDQFTHFAEYATEVVARIGLDYQKKTVRKGALFYQEQLPAESVFYAVVIAHGSRGSEDGYETPQSVLGVVRTHLPPVLQVGGDETIGRGYCAVRLVEPAGSATNEEGNR